jgi:hypothetical protein
VVTESGGRWHRPVRIPGKAVGLGSGTRSTQIDLSCAWASQCVAALTGSGPQQTAVVARELSGVWAGWRQVPGLAALSRGGHTQIEVLACGRAGWCAIAGFYWPSAPYASEGPGTPFVASAHEGIWGKAQPVPGLAALYLCRVRGIIQPYLVQRPVMPTAISCDSSGTCTLAGYYADWSAGQYRPFAVTSRDGVWGTVQPIAVSAILGTRVGDAEVSQLSCTAPGNCTAAGTIGSVNPRSLTVNSVQVSCVAQHAAGGA